MRTWTQRGMFSYSSCGKYRVYFDPATDTWMVFYIYDTKNKEGWQYFGPDCATLQEVNEFIEDLELRFKR